MKVPAPLKYSFFILLAFFTLELLTFSCFMGISTYHRDIHCCHLVSHVCDPYNFLQEAYIHLIDHYLNLTDPRLEQPHVYEFILPGLIAFHHRNTTEDFMINHNGVFYAE